MFEQPNISVLKAFRGSKHKLTMYLEDFGCLGLLKHHMSDKKKGQKTTSAKMRPPDDPDSKEAFPTEIAWGDPGTPPETGCQSKMVLKIHVLHVEMIS